MTHLETFFDKSVCRETLAAQTRPLGQVVRINNDSYTIVGVG